ncbi:MAG TPA: TIGR04283 family arsenosugar biosynthesis glycosyltransferase [Limnobacter sp.]|nr:TIGR04283 family arsenosugar biosynthesis glycosyltransferase [Limnobacter sp.]
MHKAAPGVSIVVPVFNEVPSLSDHAFASRMLALHALLRPCDELVLVDGGSSDASWPTLLALSQHPRILAIQSAKGRALQMNAGATRANSEVLVFLHADTVLGEQAWLCLLGKIHAHAGAPLWGRFDVRIEGQSKWLPVVAWFMNHRSSLSKICTGDQALFVTRRLFESVGGFPQQPLMEDVEICKRLKRVASAQFLAIRSPIMTSGRRWDVHGAWATICLMWRFRYLYWRGVPAQALARQYADTRKKAALTVALFAKYPEPGRVKTRLQPLLGGAQSAKFARYLLLSTLDKLQAENTVLWTDGGDDVTWTTLLGHRAVPRMQQPQGHLGIRMQTAVKTHLQHSEVVVLLGPDAVQFTQADLEALVRAAMQAGIAFVPALDGGYVALACTRCIPEIFTAQIAWGSATVAQQTQQALAMQGVQAQWLPPQLDIDEPQDYQRAMVQGDLPADWAERY